MATDCNADAGAKRKKKEEKKIMAEIVATTSLPVDRLTANDCNLLYVAEILSDYICIIIIDNKLS